MASKPMPETEPEMPVYATVSVHCWPVHENGVTVFVPQSVTVKAKKLYVKLVLSAPAVPGYQAYTYTKKWVVKK